jgi:hypothetical protein
MKTARGVITVIPLNDNTDRLNIMNYTSQRRPSARSGHPVRLMVKLSSPIPELPGRRRRSIEYGLIVLAALVLAVSSPIVGFNLGALSRAFCWW